MFTRFVRWLKNHTPAPAALAFLVPMAQSVGGKGAFALLDAQRMSAHYLGGINGLALGIVQTDTTPTLSDVTASVAGLVSSWGIYIGAGLILGIAVFAVVRFVRSAR